jgi:cellulose synthase/poly-beta-1,6-N-acetylglucosamine synthase-like glycosyltransferase
MVLAQIIFWSSVAVLFYVYCGYPMLVYAVSRALGKPIALGSFEPSVTIIITAYNEENGIRAKIENTLLVEYPKEKLEIIVASDGSNDATEEIVRQFSNRGVQLFRQEGRAGKTATQNAAVERSKGEIILFSDATTMYRPDVLSSLLPNFADSSIGCVAGKLVYVNSADTNIGSGAKKYWSYETFLKEHESRACSLIGVSGCLYAVRKSAYVPMYPEACSDFLICTVLYRQGLRSVYEPNAVCTEETNQRTREEFQMRVRVISQTFTDLWRNRDILNIFKTGFYGIEVISHKLLRYAVPLFLLLILFSSAYLALYERFFTLVLALEVGFYLCAFVAWLLELRRVKLGVFAVPLYFVLTNVSSTIGFYKFLRGHRFAQWEPIR